VPIVPSMACSTAKRAPMTTPPRHADVTTTP
jgi:hypothetical protein